jgi:predicted O-linked N-acetylglucosamine transferase (SPINDLY family)
MALSIKPDYAEAHSNLLSSLTASPDMTSLEIKEQHQLWDKQHSYPLHARKTPQDINLDPDRTLRIGVVSPEFFRHVVGVSSIKLFENYNPLDFELYCYSQGTTSDDYTERFKQSCCSWLDVFSLSDEELAN